jgi:hypothetical protein
MSFVDLSVNAAELAKRSVVLEPCPSTLDEYLARLWEICFNIKASKFAALHAFARY